jgi:transposase
MTAAHKFPMPTVSSDLTTSGDRFRQSAAKNDPFDARVLADFLRTDHPRLRALQPSSEAAQELKLLTEDCQRQIRQQTRLVNQLTATLKAYYPRALEVAELTTALARAFLQAYDAQRARGHSHREALRALGAKWVKIIFVLWERQVPYDEQYHLATMARQQLRQRPKKIA